MRDHPLFGPGGNSLSFYDTGHKSTLEAPAWLKAAGLDAYEFEAGNGLKASEGTLRRIGEAAAENGIAMSFHAPYYISLSGVEEEKRLKSIDYIRQSLEAAEALGASIIVVHTGSTAGRSREEAMNLCADTLYRALDTIPDNKVLIGLETMGKQNQLGTLEEVIALSQMDRRLAPVVDFGHLNARMAGNGGFLIKDDYLRVFDAIACYLGDRAACRLHCHFSKISYTAAGEKKHLTFEDTSFGPPFEPLMEAIAELRVTPTIICESDGTQAEDALAMKHYYFNTEM